LKAVAQHLQLDASPKTFGVKQLQPNLYFVFERKTNSLFVWLVLVRSERKVLLVADKPTNRAKLIVTALDVVCAVVRSTSAAFQSTSNSSSGDHRREGGGKVP
jgi:hypothetical protein